MKTTLEEAVEFFSIFYDGKHHIPSKIKPVGEGWLVYQPGSIATFDFDNMTRLVFLAHDMCIRAEVQQYCPGQIAIMVWKRKRGGSMFERHPTLEEALQQWRVVHPLAKETNHRRE